MATTVGANSLDIETMVSQPISDPAELKVDGLDYIFDQVKFEEYLSSSSSRASSLRKAQETKKAKGSSRKVWISKSARNLAQGFAFDRDTYNCLGQKAFTRDTQKCLAQKAFMRDSSKCLAQGVFMRDSLNCLAQRSFTRDSPNCLAQKAFMRDNSKCLAQGVFMRDSSKCLAQGVFKRDSSKCLARRVFNRDNSKCLARRVFNRDNSKCLAQRTFNQDTSKCLAQSSVSPDTSNYPDQRSSLPRPQQHTGGCVHSQKCPDQAGTSQPSGIPIISRLSIPQGVHEAIEGNNSKRAIIRKVTRDDNTMLVHASMTSNGQHPQKKTCPPIKDNVTLGGGNSTRVDSKQVRHYPNRPRRQAGGGSIRKRTINEIDCSCSCAQLIKTLLSGCACSESRSLPQRASVFERLSLPTAEESKLRRRRFQRGRSASQGNEFPEVTINMVNKGKGAAAAYSDPDFGARISQGGSSEDENSDSYSAIASDDTMTSVGQARESYMITPKTLAQILQEALAKQKEELRAEMKAEIELAMQQMKELQSQKVAQPGPSRNTTHDVDDSDTEENIIVDLPPKNTQSRDDTTHSAGGGNLERNEGESGRMKELESKVNALISAQEVKKTSIPCPYPREWDSIPYPPKFNLINFTPFEGRSSPVQHLIYFKSHLGVISGNEPLMIRSFVGTLRGAAFDWYRRLKNGSINCWDEMECSFLSNFFDDDTEVSIGTLLDEKQKSGESIDAFIKRFRHKAMSCKDPITEEFILQTCHNNISIDLLEAMGVVPPTTWKDLRLRGEQAERFLTRKKNERDQLATGLSESDFMPPMAEVIRTKVSRSIFIRGRRGSWYFQVPLEE